MRGVEGTVSVQFALTADGSVETAWIRRSSGDHDLDAAALAVAKRSRFRSVQLRSTGGAQGFLDYRFQLARRAASR
jgi:TonB family protein